MTQMTLNFEDMPERKAKTIEQQTGWKRTYPKMLTQDIDLLLKVTEYDYDLSDHDFVFYAISRGYMNGAGMPETFDPDYQYQTTPHCNGDVRHQSKKPFNGDIGQLRRWVREPGRGFEEFWASPDLRLTITGAAISDEDRRISWKNIQITRGRLQDCWEIYCACEKKSVVENGGAVKAKAA
ncbi:hypothetical protein AGMMS49957_01900 [Synergistales bacterium]|nr:hypothetical protein AGMMS49957_01900 [Synergistales bacterium]